MLKISNEDKKGIIENLIENTVEIIFSDEVTPAITMKNIAEESMTLKQSICDESTLKFGGCIASEFDITLIDTEDRLFTADNLVGKWIKVKFTQSYLAGSLYPSAALYPSSDVFPGDLYKTKDWYIFNGFIDSVKKVDGEQHTFNLVAYDYFAKLNCRDGTNKLITEWKNATFRPLGTMIGVFSNEIATANISSMEGILAETFKPGGDTFPIYDFPVMNKHWRKNTDKITYGEIVRFLFEMLGCFAYIMPSSYHKEGILTLVYIEQDDVPEIYDFYESLSYEDFKVNGYTHLSWNYGGDLDGNTEKVATYISDKIDESATKKVYDLTSNICCWQEEISSGANFHILNDLYNTSDSVLRFYNSGYVPISATVDGRLWVQVGDNITFNVYKTDVNGEYVLDENGNKKIETIKSIVLSRTLTGIQALTDTFETKGEI